MVYRCNRRLRRSPLRWGGFLAAILLAQLTLDGQMHKVEKPERVTRAIGVYEWTGDLTKPIAARLIPVSLFINGHFEDAGVYLARPVPFTLQSGDLYSVERAGTSLGVLDIDVARNVVTRRAAADDDPIGAWYGYGRFVSAATEAETAAKAAKLKVSANKSVVMSSTGTAESDDDTPHFVVRQGAETTDSPTAKTDTTKTDTSAKTGNTGSTQSSSPAPAAPDDPDRPTLRHRDPAAEEKRKKDKDKPGGYVSPPNTSLNDDASRPTLRRGLPAEDYLPAQMAGLPPNLHQAVAVSDPAERDTHEFGREWESRIERIQTTEALEALARPIVAAYLMTNKLEPAPAAASARPAGGPSFASKPSSAPGPPPAPTKSPTSGRKKAATPVPPTPPAFALTNEEIKGYTLSYGGLPTFVYTAETQVKTGGPVYLTMVAQRMPAGELHLALSSITDATHMDRTPWMRPVDVVDPDWSHRASLLMELRAQSSRQFALYRLVTAQAEQTFVTGVIE
jgi:hypothetical protein